MSIKREYSQNKAECKVVFILSKDFAKKFNKISVVGDFNNWSIEKNIFAETEVDGSFSATIILSTNKSYQFRYLGDGVNWFNETDADKEVNSYFEGSKNSVIII
jgi:hypothetical protein